MRVISGLSGITLFALASVVPATALEQSQYQVSLQNRVEASWPGMPAKTAGLFDVLGDVLDVTDDVLDIQEQERRREEAREERARAAQERQELIQIERIRQERLADEQRAASERQRIELEERQAQQSSGVQQTSSADMPGVIFDGNNPSSCERSRIGDGAVEATCQRFTFVDQSDLNAYLFRFLFDGELFTFIVPQEPMSKSNHVTTYMSNVMLTSGGAEDIDGFCMITAGNGDLSDFRMAQCEAVSKGLTFSYYHSR